MFARFTVTPSYRLHKPSGQAVVTLNGRDTYLGRHDTPESRMEYDRVIAEWLSNGRLPPGTTDLTINELIVRYLEFVERLLHVQRAGKYPPCPATSAQTIWARSRTDVRAAGSQGGPTDVRRFEVMPQRDQ